MKTRGALCVLVCVMIAAPALADEPELEKHSRNSCRLEGAWFGASGFGPWTAIIVEHTAQEGTVTTQWTGGTGSWFGLCEGSVRNSQGLGVWERTGPRTFEFTQVNFSLDIEGYVVCIWKNSGWGELEQGCKSGWLNGSIEFFAPDANPFEDEPYFFFPPGPDNPFVVMTVDPWVED